MVSVVPSVCQSGSFSTWLDFIGYIEQSGLIEKEMSVKQGRQRNEVNKQKIKTVIESTIACGGVIVNLWASETWI